MFSKTGEPVYKWQYPSTSDRRRTTTTSEDDVGNDSMFVDLALDSHLGIRFLIRQRRLLLYCSCEGLRYVFLCGPNVPDATWEPPSLDGETMEGGSGLPAGAGGAGPTDGSLPPPPFLNQLLRDSGSIAMTTTVRVATLGSTALGGTSPTAAVSPGKKSPKTFTSITASLTALDNTLLSAWDKERTGPTPEPYLKESRWDAPGEEAQGKNTQDPPKEEAQGISTQEETQEEEAQGGVDQETPGEEAQGISTQEMPEEEAQGIIIQEPPEQEAQGNSIETDI